MCVSVRIYIYIYTYIFILFRNKTCLQKSELCPSGWLHTGLYDCAHVCVCVSEWVTVIKATCGQTRHCLLASVKPEQHGGEGGRWSRLLEGVVFRKFTDLDFCVLASAWQVLDYYKLRRQPLQTSPLLSFLFPRHAILSVRTRTLSASSSR